ncbi:hypothetical protein RB2150_16579 [Rhodobacterales bacterium HTCC2150]|nr:hypothetical protein RB2150_16579 [Rhodobacterales bacterium HTCC2150] [Rhodobacteraceae bacterium HTCC2150]
MCPLFGGERQSLKREGLACNLSTFWGIKGVQNKAVTKKGPVKIGKGIVAPQGRVFSAGKTIAKCKKCRFFVLLSKNM